MKLAPVRVFSCKHPLSYAGRRPQQLWQRLRYAAGVKRGRVDLHQGRRVGRHRNAGKMATIEAKYENLSKEAAKHHTCPEDAEHGRI